MSTNLLTSGMIPLLLVVLAGFVFGLMLNKNKRKNDSHDN